MTASVIHLKAFKNNFGAQQSPCAFIDVLITICDELDRECDQLLNRITYEAIREDYDDSRRNAAVEAYQARLQQHDDTFEFLHNLMSIDRLSQLQL